MINLISTLFKQQNNLSSNRLLKTDPTSLPYFNEVIRLLFRVPSRATKVTGLF